MERQPTTLILGIETSCDETAAAVVADGRYILSNVVASQNAIHAQYGGVFPEMASRAHIETIIPVVDEAMDGAGVEWGDLAGIAVTFGPGLAGSLLVGVNTAKGLALARDLPLLGVSHLEGHIYANWLQTSQQPRPFEPEWPLLALIVSGGHTELVLVRHYGVYEVLGRTLDDAAGESFDKVARMLGLGYPGGPEIQRAAGSGRVTAFDFPRAWLPDTYDFSFSGLKTAVLREVEAYKPKPASGGSAGLGPRIVRELPVSDLAASFQEAVVDVLVEKTVKAAEGFEVKQVLVSGGVSANRRLREQMHERAEGRQIYFPPLFLCTDNGAMIAAAGYWAGWRLGRRSGWDLDVVPGLRLDGERVGG
ncbi:MAG: tRNA (adenosine(37)-N6)-threonylcarbamoyltransferase complex transferase subunit TsaD [Anaerolineae bacterium]